MLSEELKQKVNQSFNQSFVGDANNFSDEEISTIYDEVGSILLRISDWGEVIRESEYRIVVFALVQLTKEWGDNEDSWLEYISKKLLGSQGDIRGKIYTQICKCIDALGDNGTLFLLKSSRKKYYATMCCHAFAPKKSVYSLFEICWEIYFKDLEGQYLSDSTILNIISKSLRNKFFANEDEDDVTIGSKIYSFRAGVKGLAIEQSDLLKQLLDDTFISIDSVMNNVPIKTNSYFGDLFKYWWYKKQESLGERRQIAGVKREFIASDYSLIKTKFIVENAVPKLVISQFRINDDASEEPQIEIFINGKISRSEFIPTYSGSGLLKTTKQLKYDIDSFRFDNRIDISCKIYHCGKLIYDSKSSLYRPFLLFSQDGKELTSKILIPAEYFLYLPSGIDGFTLPNDIHCAQGNLFSLTAHEGEIIRSNSDIIFFNNEKNEKEIYFLFNAKQNLLFRKNGLSYKVVDGEVSLCILNDNDINNIGIRYEDGSFPLSEFEHEEKDGRHIFKITILAEIGEPVSITVFRYSDNYIYALLDIVKLNEIKIDYDKPLYYGDNNNYQGEVSITIGKNCIHKEFNIYEEENFVDYNEGELLFEPPILKWKFDDDNWHVGPISSFYYNEISNTSILKIDMPIGLDCHVILLEGTPFIIDDDGKNGEYQLGQLIHYRAKDNKITHINLMIRCNNSYYELSRILLKASFIKEPLYIDSESFAVEWDPSSYKGEKCEFKLCVFDNSSKQIAERSLSNSAREIINFGALHENYYKFKVVSISGIFVRKEETLFEKSSYLGNIKNLRFQCKTLKVAHAKFFDSNKVEMIKPIYIDNLRYLQTSDEGLDYYSGMLFVYKECQKKYLNIMVNQHTNEKVTINPVMVVMKTLTQCYLGYGLHQDDSRFDYDNEFLVNNRGITTIGTSKQGRTVDYYLFTRE